MSLSIHLGQDYKHIHIYMRKRKEHLSTYLYNHLIYFFVVAYNKNDKINKVFSLSSLSFSLHSSKEMRDVDDYIYNNEIIQLDRDFTFKSGRSWKETDDNGTWNVLCLFRSFFFLFFFFTYFTFIYIWEEMNCYLFFLITKKNK